MFRNYLAAALRSLIRNRLYAVINVIGLAVGFAAALLIALFVRDEVSYDQWLPDHDRTFVVTEVLTQPGNAGLPVDRAPYIAAALLKQDFPQIQTIARLAPVPAALRHDEVEFQETIMWADAGVFDVLRLPSLAGNLATALQEPDGLVITRSIARKYFGRDDVVGEIMEINRQVVMRVTAVLEDLPSNTHLNLSVIGAGQNASSMLTTVEKFNSTGFIPNTFTYLRLDHSASIDDLRAGLPDFIKRHPRFETPEVSYALGFAPVTAMHLRPPGGGAMSSQPRGSVAVVTGAAIIALLIMAVAGINFVNLATAGALRRAVEVGIRKVSGAERRMLILQFIAESTALAAVGMIGALLMASVLVPSFNAFLGRNIHFALGHDPVFAGIVAVIVLLVGVAAGAYPALVLSRFSPTRVLKGASQSMGRGRGRQMLVAAQFAILITLALVATTVYRQTGYALNEALRFDKDQMLVIMTAPDQFSPTSCDMAFAVQVRALPGVRGATCSSNTISLKLFDSPPAEVAGPGGAVAKPDEMIVGFDFFELYGLKPLAGRFFSRAFGGDEGAAARTPSNVVINQALSRGLGFDTPARAVGQVVRWRPLLPMTRAGVAKVPEDVSEIIGVVPDFEASARKAASPQIFWVNPAATLVLNVKLVGDQVPETLAAIDRLWKQVGPPRPISRRFLDQSIQAQYRDVTRLDQALAAFTAVAVFIACLGLFGLAAFSAEGRTKEIGVRKAMGASKGDVLRLILWEFSRPVLWGSLAAWPMAYALMGRWLETFAERVDIGWWLFPAISALALAIAAVTVSGHALRVARTRPASALRYE